MNTDRMNQNLMIYELYSRLGCNEYWNGNALSKPRLAAIYFYCTGIIQYRVSIHKPPMKSTSS